MPSDSPQLPTMTPAEKASADAIEALYGVLDRRQNFLVEAGAGAGKTYSLVRALQFLTEKRGAELLAKGQRIACITYTNVASDEIRSRTDGHPAIFSSTIHTFCWSLISPYQPILRKKLLQLPKWPERLADAGEIGSREVLYNLGHPSVKDGVVLLGHADVIKLAAMILEEEKLRRILVSRFPIILIDEYQDTNRDFAEALLEHFVLPATGPLIGFFGDHWQKIYDDGCGAIAAPEKKLVRINQGANFRSVSTVVNVLNAMRPELRQAIKDSSIEGFAAVYHTNSWTGARQTKNHWKGDLPPQDAHDCLEKLRTHLEKNGWDPQCTKILMLTHNVLAKEQGYASIVEALDGSSERFAKKEDPYIKFLIDVVESICDAYSNRRFGEMFEILGTQPGILRPADKSEWAREMDALVRLRASGTIREVLEHVKKSQRFPLPEDVSELEDQLKSPSPALDEKAQHRLDRARSLGEVPYREIIALANFINESTPFATKHGVKGAEFENVLVVVGRGWAKYNFCQMLEWHREGVPAGKESSFEDSRNLFYVVCSRPKTRLAVLFTQELTSAALATLEAWFGKSNIHSAFDVT